MIARDFSGLVRGRIAREPEFGAALLRESVEAVLAGDVEAGKAILRDYIKATVGFERLGEATGGPPRRLIRMFGPRGNLRVRELFGVIGLLQREAGVRLRVG